ncbi:ankyrin repeat-containing domain protein [Dunaliella salina]|uniref:Ankyrin repeat-containing domain protein n=1 Tax=Dunaliella salina TaxID=3046 RepID=A0ABQ7GQ53_DUNSA|nr:ankyrin repeat-containing domain protein [Dunaliella salina]|eukprot:KAF5836740.1 ankyrin repeat-containing domain protein [Dunaliella salina]
MYRQKPTVNLQNRKVNRSVLLASFRSPLKLKTMREALYNAFRGRRKEGRREGREEGRKERNNARLVALPNVDDIPELISWAADGTAQLCAGADVEMLNWGDWDGRTPLWTASFNGQKEVVHLLLNKGAAVDKADKEGFTPLSVASLNGHLDVACLLLERGAAVDMANKDGITPSLLASQNGHLEVIRLLLEKGAAVDRARDGGFTPLFAASEKGHLKPVGLLLEGGAAVNKATDNGYTPLIIACYNGHLPVVRLLCERGANLHAADNDGVTAFEWAIKRGHPAVAAYMKEQQAARSAARPAASPPAPKSSTGASAARSAASPSATKSSTGAFAQRKIDVFVSFRVKEAEPEAIALKRALEAENLSVFCSSVDIPKGSDWVQTIAEALRASTLVAVLATPTYGSRGTDSFATSEELNFALRKRKLLYVVPMAEEWENAATDLLLGNIQKGAQWETNRNVAPSAIVNDIVGALQRAAA